MSSICLYQANKTNLFASFGKYLEDCYFTANSYQNVKFCDIVEIWKNLNLKI